MFPSFSQRISPDCLQVQNVPGQMFMGMLLSFTPDHHLEDSCSERLQRRGWTLRWKQARWWFCLKGGDWPTFLFCVPPSLFPLLATTFILCLHSSISQSTCRFVIFPFPPLLYLTHLTWSGFVTNFDYFLFPLLSTCRSLYCWWVLQLLFSEGARTQDEKT